jgi:hypothetical protein
MSADNDDVSAGVARRPGPRHQAPQGRETPATPVPAPAPVKVPLVTKHRKDDEPELVGAAS